MKMLLLDVWDCEIRNLECERAGRWLRQCPGKGRLRASGRHGAGLPGHPGQRHGPSVTGLQRPPAGSVFDDRHGSGRRPGGPGYGPGGKNRRIRRL